MSTLKKIIEHLMTTHYYKSNNNLQLKLEITNIDRQSVHLEWNKPEYLSDPLFELYINEKGRRNWIIIYRGFRTYFYAKGLSGGHTYKFRLSMESDDYDTNNSENYVATVSCTTKKSCPSVTAFHHSAYQNLPLLFREFLETRPKDVNVFNEMGECALSRACAAGHNDMVLALIQYGADVNLPNMFTGTTPLMTAAYYGHCDIIRILAHNNADAVARDVNFKTALHYAVDGSQNDAVKMLLEEKWSDINSKDSKGWTPLMRAVLLFASLDVIKSLIDHGSNLNIKDKNGQNVWQLAHLANNWKALKLLPE